MPNDTVAIHPGGLKITFQEEDHSYTDEIGREYTSVTTLIHRGFEVFDGPAAAARKSLKTGVPAEQYLREWEEAGEDASFHGTRLHENCERQILGRYGEMHRPADEEERLRFRAAWEEVEKIKAKLYELQPEKIIFSPRFRVAGSIDLLGRKSVEEFRLFDWKVIKELKKEGYRGKRGIIFPTLAIPDCNFFHYALQLSVYELILKAERYIPATAKLNRWLFVYSNGAFRYENLPDMAREAALLLAWNISGDLDEVPF